jgi:hypothetical protein
MSIECSVVVVNCKPMSTRTPPGRFLPLLFWNGDGAHSDASELPTGEKIPAQLKMSQRVWLKACIIMAHSTISQSPILFCSFESFLVPISVRRFGSSIRERACSSGYGYLAQVTPMRVYIHRTKPIKRKEDQEMQCNTISCK